MSPFWHWFVVVITVGMIAATIWFLIWTMRLRVPSQTEEDGAETTGHVWDGDLRELNNPLPRWWLWLFWGTIAFSVVYLVLYPGLGRFEGTLGWSQSAQYQAERETARAAFVERFGALAAHELTALAADPEALTIGRNVFAHNCSTCHGSDARGAVGFPNLTDNHWRWGGEPEQVLHSVLHGRQGVMPGFGAALGEDGVTRTAIFVQQLAGRTVDQTMAAAGRRHYEQLCVACHGPDGRGNTLLGAPDLTVGIYSWGGDLESLRHTIAEGRAAMMPAQQPLIGEIRSRFVAAYVLSLNQDHAN